MSYVPLHVLMVVLLAQLASASVTSPTNGAGLAPQIKTPVSGGFTVTVAGVLTNYVRCVAYTSSEAPSWGTDASIWNGTASAPASMIQSVQAQGLATPLVLTFSGLTSGTEYFVRCGASTTSTNTGSDTTTYSTYIESTPLSVYASANAATAASAGLVSATAAMTSATVITVTFVGTTNEAVRCIAFTSDTANPFDTIAHFWAASLPSGAVESDTRATGSSQTAALTVVTGTLYYVKCAASKQTTTYTAANTGYASSPASTTPHFFLAISPTNAPANVTYASSADEPNTPTATGFTIRATHTFSVSPYSPNAWMRCVAATSSTASVLTTASLFWAATGSVVAESQITSANSYTTTVNATTVAFTSLTTDTEYWVACATSRQTPEATAANPTLYATTLVPPPTVVSIYTRAGTTAASAPIGVSPMQPTDIGFSVLVVLPASTLKQLVRCVAAQRSTIGWVSAASMALTPYDSTANFFGVPSANYKEARTAGTNVVETVTLTFDALLSSTLYGVRCLTSSQSSSYTAVTTVHKSAMFPAASSFITGEAVASNAAAATAASGIFTTSAVGLLTSIELTAPADNQFSVTAVGSATTGRFTRCIAATSTSDAVFANKTAFWTASTWDNYHYVYDGNSLTSQTPVVISATSTGAGSAISEFVTLYVKCAESSQPHSVTALATSSSGLLMNAIPYSIRAITSALASPPTAIVYNGATSGGFSLTITAVAQTIVRCVAGTGILSAPFDTMARFWTTTTGVVDVETTTTSTAFLFKGLTPGTQYYFRCASSVNTPAFITNEINQLRTTNADALTGTVPSTSLSAVGTPQTFTAVASQTVSSTTSTQVVADMGFPQYPSLTIPAYAIQSTLAIAVTISTPLSPTFVQTASDLTVRATIMGAAVVLLPDGTTFSTCATITVPYTSTAGINGILYKSSTSAMTDLAPYHATLVSYIVDPSTLQKYAETCVYSFSTYVVGSPALSAPGGFSCTQGQAHCVRGLCFKPCD